MRKLLSCAALFCGAAVAAGLGAQEKNKFIIEEPKGGAKLEGGYTIVSGEEGGKAIPAERIKGSMVRFTGDTITGTDKDKKEFFAAKYTLDTARTPWVIKMTSTAPKEADATGLVKKDGDTVTIVYALPGGSAPTEFKTKEKQQLFVLKSAKAGETGKGKAKDTGKN